MERRCADRGVPRRDREGEEALARLGNGEPQLGHLSSCQVHMSGLCVIAVQGLRMADGAL
jgi:hypothetical protein